VPNTRGVEDNEIASQLVRFGTKCPLIGPESASRIAAADSKKVVVEAYDSIVCNFCN
jgi:hypothetical protein